MKDLQMLKTVFHISVLFCICIGLSGCKSEDGKSANDGNSEASGSFAATSYNRLESQIREVNESEDLVLQLTPSLHVLAAQLKNKTPNVAALFADSVEYKGLAKFDLNSSFDAKNSGASLLPFQLSQWPLGEDFRTVSKDQISDEIWGALTEFGRFTDTQFGITKAELHDDQKRFVAETIFEGRLLSRSNGQDGLAFGVKAFQSIEFRRQDDGSWKISRWNQDSLKFLRASKTLFRDVTDQAIPDSSTLSKVNRSRHEELLLKRAAKSKYLSQFEPVLQFFSDYHSLFQYPSVSVIDIDADGHEDLFLTDRHGGNFVLRNQGDGTFKDYTSQSGLTLEPSYSNCALFADFDNDGDADLLLGRSVGQCLYYQNQDGKFSIDANVCRQLVETRFVTSGSVADINRDGLPDVYLSTYASRAGSDMRWVEFVVPPPLVHQFAYDALNKHSFLDRHGPPNFVLMNRNGVLTPVKISKTLEQWRNTFQTAWIDYDEDGDDDLYVCNDFAPDALLENNTKRGSFELSFTDVTEDAFRGETMGFGMGASVGDYDSDGRLDIYISNMYSKAGKRVIGGFDGDVDPRISGAAKGCFLYRNVGKNFQQVAGMEPDAQHVSKVGWSFGGQFADFNNDGRLDVYVPSGFFSAPKSIAKDVDL